MAATRAELAEDTAVYLLPRPTFETVDRGELVYIAGMRHATVHRLRTDDVAAALDVDARGVAAARPAPEGRVVARLVGDAARTRASSCSSSGSCPTRCRR